MLLGCLCLCVAIGAHAQQSPVSPAPSPGIGEALPEGPAPSGEPGIADSPPPTRSAGETMERSTVHSVRSVSGSQGARSFGKGAFEPSMRRPIEWGDVPESGERMSYSATAGPLSVVELLDAIAVATGWNVVSSKGIEDLQVRLWTTSVTPRELLHFLRFHGVYYAFDDEYDLLQVMLVEEHIKSRFGEVEKQVFPVAYAEVLDMEAIIQALLSENGKMLVDPRTGNIIVWDTPDNLTEMEEALDRLDKPVEQAIFELHHTDALNVVESIQYMLSEVGNAYADPRSNTIVVQDLPSRHDQIQTVIDALDRPLETRTWTLSYIEPDLVIERLGEMVPAEMGQISSDEDTHQISVTAIDERLREIDKLIADWDVPRKQVEIEAYVVSMSSGVARDLGINWNYFDESSGTSFALQSGSADPSYDVNSEGERLTIGRLPFQVPLVNWWTGNVLTDAAGDMILDPEFKGSRISAVINYLEEDKKAKVLSRPRVAVLDGEEAVFKNTRDLPYQTGGYSDYNYTGGTPGQVNYNRVIPLRTEFVSVGTVLKVKPRISEDGNIVMDVSAEDSDARSDVVVVGDQQSTVPSKSESSAETQVMIRDGETLVIGGLRTGRVQEDVQRVPILGDIPGLGRLFRTTGRSHEDRDLMIFLTPTIVDERSRPEAARLTESIQGITQDVRQANESAFARAASRLRGGKDEFIVAISQWGSMYADGRRTDLTALADRLAQIERPGTVTVRIELHPNGPIELADEVAALAHERGLKTEITTEAAPFVTPDRPGEAPSTDAETPEGDPSGDELPDGEPDPLAY